MADLRLASAGDDIKLWECSGFSQLNQFNPHTNQNISSICWSNDNTCIASSSTGGDKISFSYLNSATHAYDMHIGESCTCLAFNSTSRYIMGGGTSGIIQAWDVKTQTVKKSYRDHKGPITSVQMNWNDNDLASGSETGEIIIFNVITGQGSIPLTTPRVQAVRQLQYSHFKKSLLGAVSEDGTLNMWDTNRRSLAHSFTDLHKAPATGLAFSQLNEMLMMSVGLDKRIVCYDVQRLEVVKTIMADSPLTSIDLMNDGSTFVVGSMRGKIFVYDLRQAALPVRQMSAHKSSVQHLAFQGKPLGSVGGAPARSGSSARKNTNNNPAKVGGKTSRTTTPRTTTPRSDMQSDINGVTSQGLDSRNNNRVETINTIKDTAGYDTIFSPIRDSCMPSSGHTTSDTPGDMHTNSANGSLSKYGDGIFSPLGDTGNYSSRTQYSSSGLSFQSTPSAVALRSVGGGPARGHLPPPTDVSPTTSSEDATTPTLSHHGSLSGSRVAVDPAGFHHSQSDPVITPPTIDRVTRSSSTPLSHANHQQTPEDAGAIGLPHEQRSKHPTSSTSSVPQEAGASLDTSWHRRSRTHSTNQIQGAEGGAPASFQKDLVRAMIDDALEDFRDQIRQDVLNLHMDMLKQFHLQQAEMRTLLQQYSVNQDLMTEIERLREENEKLKRKF